MYISRDSGQDQAGAAACDTLCSEHGRPPSRARSGACTRGVELHAEAPLTAARETSGRSSPVPYCGIPPALVPVVLLASLAVAASASARPDTTNAPAFLTIKVTITDNAVTVRPNTALRGTMPPSSSRIVASRRRSGSSATRHAASGRHRDSPACWPRTSRRTWSCISTTAASFRIRPPRSAEPPCTTAASRSASGAGYGCQAGGAVMLG